MNNSVLYTPGISDDNGGVTSSSGAGGCDFGGSSSHSYSNHCSGGSGFSGGDGSGSGGCGGGDGGGGGGCSGGGGGGGSGCC